MSSYFRSFFINCEHPRSSTSYHLWPLFVWPCVFLLWPQCYCPHSSLVDTSFGCNQRLSLYVSLSIHLQGYTICGNSGRESNPPFQPTTRLSPKTVSGDRPSTAAVIKPSALSLFLLRKVNSIWVSCKTLIRLQRKAPYHSVPLSSSTYIISNPDNNVKLFSFFLSYQLWTSKIMYFFPSMISIRFTLCVPLVDSMLLSTFISCRYILRL